MRFILSIFIILISYSTIFAAYPSGKALLDKIDKNYNFQTQVAETTMIIQARRGKRKIQSRSYMTKNDQSFTEYLAPAREKGTKMLKLKDALWTYSPMADRVIKIAGHLLRQSVMGSDLSYEDMMETDELAEAYEANVIGTEVIDSRDCYIVELIGKKSDLAYYKRKIWVDQKRYLGLREERFAKSGKLLKTTQITEVMKLKNGKWYPKKMVFKDVLKAGEGTTFIIDKVTFDIPIPKYLFTKAVLRK